MLEINILYLISYILFPFHLVLVNFAYIWFIYVRSSDTLPHPQGNAYEARNYIQPSSHIAVPHQGQFGNQVHN